MFHINAPNLVAISDCNHVTALCLRLLTHSCYCLRFLVLRLEVDAVDRLLSVARCFKLLGLEIRFLCPSTLILCTSLVSLDYSIILQLFTSIM